MAQVTDLQHAQVLSQAVSLSNEIMLSVREEINEEMNRSDGN